MEREGKGDGATRTPTWRPPRACVPCLYAGAGPLCGPPREFPAQGGLGLSSQFCSRGGSRARRVAVCACARANPPPGWRTWPRGPACVRATALPPSPGAPRAPPLRARPTGTFKGFIIQNQFCVSMCMNIRSNNQFLIVSILNIIPSLKIRTHNICILKISWDII